ncbi:glutaminyl-peptide cyclotransferase-like [Littorina saxatilis]|uniref:Glutaminyl-peptide cyclotransferase n=1 Tax=Littorina saxatilis TaxID=31220 RepID=A0AAN9BET4_9CAEN
MAMAAVRWTVALLVLCFAVVCTVTQNTGCGSLEKQYVRSNLGNLSAGVSNIQQLRDLALRPLIQQTRVPGTYGSSLAQTHIKTWMSAVGWTVEEDKFTANTPYGIRHFSNVIATLNPGKARRVVLACHYDTKLNFYARFVGAIDSAVPCSLLMDTALRLYTLFQANKQTTSDLTLQFIFFDGEEAFVRWSRTDSLYGSRHLAEKWANTPDPNVPGRNNLQGIDTFILLDLIGTPDTHFKLKYTNTAPQYNKLSNIESCLRSYGLLKTTTYTTPLFTSQQDLSLIEDDHLPFLTRGVPIVHLITSPFPNVWHQPTDDLAALDFDRIENLARVLRIYLTDLPL